MAANDVDLWVLTAEAVLSRGRSLEDAIATADRVIAAYWRNRPRRPGRPGLAKCGLGLASAERRRQSGIRFLLP